MEELTLMIKNKIINGSLKTNEPRAMSFNNKDYFNKYSRHFTGY
jgi:hypothetical protein